MTERELKWPDWWCRWCQAKAGEPCRTYGGKVATRPHMDRRRHR